MTFMFQKSDPTSSIFTLAAKLYHLRYRHDNPAYPPPSKLTLHAYTPPKYVIQHTRIPARQYQKPWLIEHDVIFAPTAALVLPRVFHGDTGDGGPGHLYDELGKGFPYLYTSVRRDDVILSTTRLGEGWSNGRFVFQMLFVERHGSWRGGS